MKQKLSCRIYPRPDSPHYYLLLIYPSYKSFMMNVVRKMGLGDNLAAATITFDEKAGNKFARKVGEIYLYPDSLTYELIAHEIDHAVTAYVTMFCKEGKEKILPETEEDEFRAQIAGWMNQQAWDFIGETLGA